MPVLALAPLFGLLACGGDISPGGEALDTAIGSGFPVCGRVNGTGGIMLYQQDATLVRTPAEPPGAAEVGSAVAGPLDSEGLSWRAIVGGRVLASEDAGCSWAPLGTIAGGADWALRAGGGSDAPRLYAFDRNSGSLARSTDAGASWTALDAGESFLGVPQVDPSNGDVLRGVQPRGVVTSADGGESWQLSGALPAGERAPAHAAVAPGLLDTIWVAGPGGAWRSQDGGAAWTRTYEAGDGDHVAIAADDPTRVWLLAYAANGLLATWTTGEGGDTPSGRLLNWDRALDEAQAPLTAKARIWPIPGSPGRALAAHGPVENSSGDAAVNVYVMEAGVGTRTVRVGTFVGVNDLAFGEDRWIAAVLPAGG
jgi:hypothetical protein